MYEIKKQVVGYLEQQEVKTIEMPRERFLEVVERTINGLNYDEDAREFVRNEVAPVARTIKWFPFHNWFITARGCGCLIGEYLIASPELAERGRNVEKLEADDVDGRQMPSVQKALLQRIGDYGFADAMLVFGNDVDWQLTQEVRESINMGTRLEGVVLTIVD